MFPPGEAVTMMTDYLLALTGILCAGWLFVRGQGAPARWWSAAFAATAVAAILGGTSHGYGPLLARETHGLVWRLTYVTVGLGNFGILYGAVLAALPRRWHRPTAVILALRLLLVAAALVALGEFRYVLYDYAITLAGLATLAVAMHRRRWAGAGWLIAGVVTSLGGAAVQLAHLGQGHAFNHNDLFHVLQAAGLICYARAGRRLPPTSAAVIRSL